MKENDWIVANINNPEFTASDFKDIGGLSLDNTQLLPFDDYLKYDKITSNPLFLNDLGTFDKLKFKTFYDLQASKFGDFLKTDIDNYQYGFWDVFKKPDSRVRDPEFKLEAVANPTHQSLGVTGLWARGPRTKSDFELAETLKIFDWEKGTFRDSSPEDFALFSNPFKFVGNLFSEPLVFAKYEEDTDEIDPFTGLMVHHLKGENKVNEYGEYYFETLGGRSLVGKLVLSVGDVITKEDTAVNKYDFFDSDDLEKSPEGVIAKNLAAVAPMILGGPASTIYAGLYVGREMLKTLPMLERMSQIFIGTDYETPMLSTLAAYGEKFTGGTSDYAKNKAFSFENFGNMVSDVALQWGLLKFIADAWSKITSGNNELIKLAETKAASEYAKQARNILNRANKGELVEATALRLAGVKSVGEVELALASGGWKLTAVGLKALLNTVNSMQDDFVKNLKLGLDLSLIYMALISNTDVYESALEHGATKTEAATVALGSTLGMFVVDKYLGLGEMFFDDEGAAQRRLFRKTLKDVYDKDVKEIVKSVEQSAATETAKDTRKGLIKIMDSAKRKTKEFLEGYRIQAKDRALSLMAKSVGEGLEETSEELVTDLTKSLYEVAGQFGIASQKDIGAWDNMGERYAMSFFGGAIGGAMYGGIDMLKHPKTAADTDARDTLLTLVRQGHTGKLIDTLEEMRKEGKLGDKNLSIDTTKDEAGNHIFLTADDKHISLNDFNFNQMKTAILLMDKIINGNQLGLTDDLLFEKMLLSDMKLMSLLGVLKDTLKDASYMSGYYKDFQKIVTDIYDNETKLDDLRSKNTDEVKRNSEEFKELETKLLKEREKLNLRKEDFFKNKSLYYLNKTMFVMNPEISGALMPMTYEQYVRVKYSKGVEDLAENLKENSKIQYENYLKNRKQKDVDEAFEAWMEIQKRIDPTLKDLDPSKIDDWGNIKKEFEEFVPKFLNPNFNERIGSLEYDVDLELKGLGIKRTDEYDKPWRSDPTKVNKAFDLLLEEDPEMRFQIVKDIEDKYWSIHFKTDNPKLGSTSTSYSGLNDKLKLRLFKAAALVIPEGEFLSTWGELTKGGISGIKRFGDETFTGNIRFKLVGTRLVKTKPTISGKIDRSKYAPAKVDIDSTGQKEYILTNELGLEIPLFGYSLLKVTFKDGSTAYINKELTDPETLIKNNEVELLDDKGETFKVNANNIVKVEDGDLLVSELTTSQEDIEIPIWQKVTGETDEEYENRDTLLEGESEEEFRKRREERMRRLKEEAFRKEMKVLKKLVESDKMIDSNTYRYIISRIRLRAKDLKNAAFSNWKKDTSYYSKLLDIIQNLEEDLSNKDLIWEQIKTLVEEDLITRIRQKLLDFGIASSDFFPDDLKTDEEGFITFKELIDYLKEKFVFEDEGKSFPVYWDNFSLSIWNPRLGVFLDNISFQFKTEKGELDLVKNDIKDYFNIIRYLENPDIEFIIDNDENTLEGGGIQLYNTYNIKAKIGDEEIETEIKGAITNKEVLLNIKNQIEQKYTGKDGSSNRILFSEKVAKKQKEQYSDVIKKDFDYLIEKLQKDERYKTLQMLPKKVAEINRPTLKLIKAIAENLGVEFSDIESTLKDISIKYQELPEASDFTLSDSLIEALETAKNLLELAKAAITAASGDDTYFTPWPYNKTINEWNEAHKAELTSEIDKLTELDKNTADILLLDLYLYQLEINAWITRAKENGINKQKMFLEFDEKFEKVKLDLIEKNISNLKLSDGTNLLHGYVKKPTSKDSVLEFERVFYKNVKDALDNGHTEEEIFDVISKCILWDNVKFLKSSKLNNNLNELTEYDKFIYLITSACYNPDNFYVDYKEFVEQNKNSIAPLSAQKYAIKLLKAQENNLDFINKMLNFFKEKSGFEGDVLENTSIVTGIGGAGKTSVVIKGIKSDNTFISGPSPTQIQNLKKHIEDGKEYSKEDLLKFILKDLYNAFIENIRTEKGDLIKYSESITGMKVLKPNISKIKLDTIENPPKQIIIDEATLLKNAELLVIAKFCKLNNIHLVLVGDENQNGDMTSGWNMSREFCLALRVPKLGISLRDNNLWKYDNQVTLQNLEDSLRDTDTAEETNAVHNRLISEDLAKFQLKYYDKNGLLYGDKIVSTLEDKDVDSLKGKICFVGDASSEAYKKLKASGKDVEIKTLEEVLGHEFPYVVCDINWGNIIGDKSIMNVLKFMQTLYTIITRSLEGTIIINNGLSSIIKGNSEQGYNAPTVNIDKNARERFVKNELDWLNNHTWNPVKEEEKKKKTTAIKKEEEVELKDKPTPITEPIVVEGENDDEEEEKVIKNLDDESLPKDPSLQVHIYTNFNYLGVNRNVIDDEHSEWFNDSDNHKDIGIFLRKGDGKITEDFDKLRVSDLLLDLKSAILFNKTQTGDYRSNVFDYVPRENLKNIKYYVVRERYDKLTHHLVTEELDLTELPDGTVMYTLQARFLDKYGNECTLTLGTLPKPESINTTQQKNFYKKDLQRIIDSNKASEEYKEWCRNLLTDESAFEALFKKYENDLNNIPEEGKRINRPVFSLFTGTRKLKYRLRLEEVNSVKSRYDARTSAYVTSDVYVHVKKGEEDAGKPFILVSADRSLSSKSLLDLYLEQQENPEGPAIVRKVMLDSTGVSFESLFDYRYKDDFTSLGSKNNEFTFPFLLVPMGIRMYIAMHNFRARLLKIKNKLEEKYSKEELSKLNDILKEESRLFYLYKESYPEGLNEDFKSWLGRNLDKISKEITFDEIKKLWNFNENDLKDVKQFRLGYNSDSGVYVRNISKDLNGNYINLLTLDLWLGTINKFFDVALNKIIPPEILDNNNIKEITEIADYRGLKDDDNNWVGILEEQSTIGLTLDLAEDDGGGVKIDIPSKKFIQGLPVIMCLIVKNLQARSRMSNDLLTEKFKDYNSDAENHYAVSLKDADGNLSFINYLEILRGGLGEIGHKETPDIGVREGKSGLRDLRLIDMFNVLFHGAVSLWTSNKEEEIIDKKKVNRNDFLKDRKAHATEVAFPYGFFVDAIVSGLFDEDSEYGINNTSRKYFATNLVPSGTKTYITLNDYVEEEEGSEGDEGEDERNINEITELNENIIKTLNWDESWCTTSISTKDDLINAVNKKLKEDISDLYFGNSSEIQNLQLLLDVPFEASLSDSGELIIKTIKDSNDLLKTLNLRDVKDFLYFPLLNKFYFRIKTNEEIEISQRGGDIFVTSKITNIDETGKVSLNGEDVIKSIKESDELSDELKDDLVASDYKDIKIENPDDRLKDLFKADFKKRLQKKVDIDDDDIDTIDNILDRYINLRCTKS